jgi:N-acetylneuraminic acid mutarotase
LLNALLIPVRFGGTDGVTWFNDVWTYEPRSNTWTELDCIGYIPVAREGHSAAIVNDTMYIFGGRTQEGIDLGDLAAFRITRIWATPRPHAQDTV